MYIVPQEPLKLYSYNELSKEAKETAYEEWKNNKYKSGFLDWDDYEQAMKDFANTFGLTIKDYSIGSCSYSYIRFDVDSGDIEELTGLRLYKYLYNKLTREFCCTGSKFWRNKDESHITFINSYNPKLYEKNGKQRFSKVLIENENVFTDWPLTGCWTDAFYHETIVEFLKHPDLKKTYKELMEDAFDCFIKNCLEDERYSYSEEYFKEYDAQESYFYETGSIYGRYFDNTIEQYKVNENVEFSIDND